jgi:hypothetical protein
VGNKRVHAELCLQLDITEIVQPGTKGYRPPSWKCEFVNPVTNEVRLTLAGVLEPGGLAYKLTWLEVEQTIKLVGISHPKLGGVKWGWECPKCQKRCDCLYYYPVEWREGWRCKTCANLIFPSQRRSASWKSELRKLKQGELEQRLSDPDTSGVDSVKLLEVLLETSFPRRVGF